MAICIYHLNFPAEWRALLDNDDADISSICSGARDRATLRALLDGHSADLVGPVAQFSRTIDSIAKIVSNTNLPEPRAQQVWGALGRTLELSKTRSSGVLLKVLGCFIELEPGLRSLLDEVEAQSPDAYAAQVLVAEALEEVILLFCHVIRTLWRNGNDVNALQNWDRAICDQVEKACRGEALTPRYLASRSCRAGINGISTEPPLGFRPRQ
ncbi:hypothetical protein B0H67DRAFT_264223 [Lasiosphaeris hirsuta]|uniref:Uncharacterized protein n=1 Tax=Lasiosphaeris hirsuta TaxID=260670 RepID=A0AA40A7J8_9PEZI|nr:hypothetical protein B0H67DRAFT_264223 [Lasiosphaeris hirsuta]